MKFCEDCRYFIKGTWRDECIHEFNVEPTNRKEGYWSAKICRAHGWLGARVEGLCGREGRFFEKKD